MFGLSAEHLIIIGAILLIFGPRKIPELAQSLGKAVRNFRDHTGGIIEPTYRKVSETIEKPNQTNT